MGLNQKQKEKSKSTLPKNLQGSVSSAQSQCTQSAHALQFDRRTHILGTDAQCDETRANQPLWVRFTSAFYTYTHTHTELTNRKYYRCKWAQWRRHHVCARAWSSVWIWKDVGPLEEVICFHVIFTPLCLCFCFHPLHLSLLLTNQQQQPDWVKHRSVCWLCSSSLVSVIFLSSHIVRKTLALLPHLICISFPFRGLVWL